MAYLEMAKLVFKWAFKKPATGTYPAQPRTPIEGSRGQLEMNDTCVFCSACAKKCPTNAIVVDRANKTLEIERLRCISCGYCVEICPKDSLQLNTDHAAAAVEHGKDSIAKPAPAKPAVAAPVVAAEPRPRVVESPALDKTAPAQDKQLTTP